jgi:hypothetical protein
MLENKSFKKYFYEKVKMFKKGLFVVESFVTIGSFDYDYIHMQPIWLKDVKEFVQT